MVEVIKETLTAEQLMAKIAAAGASGDITEVIRLGNLLRKQKSDIEKAESDKLQKEAEAMAGDRANLAGLVLEGVVSGKPVRGLADKLTAVKATGYTYKLPFADANGVMTNADKGGSVALLVPTIKTKRAGGGGGAGVSTKAQTGMNLAELIEAYATAEQKVAIQAAYDGAVKNKGSAKWQEQIRVKKDILVKHPDLVK